MAGGYRPFWFRYTFQKEDGIGEGRCHERHLGSAWWDERIELAQKYPNDDAVKLRDDRPIQILKLLYPELTW